MVIAPFHGRSPAFGGLPEFWMRSDMKTSIIILALLFISPAISLAEPPPGVSLGVFYSSLDPYGEWISISGDVYAWRPTQVEADWRPYAYGNWVWTDDGWYWASDEPWSWAVYHYGRWYYDDYYGWVWIPGYDWAPAWVEWRYGGDCVGWAPLGPYAVFSASFGIFYRTSWVTPYRYWCFTDWRYMTSRGLHQYVYRTGDNTRFIGRTRPGGSVAYEGGRIMSRGPERQFVERRGNVRIDRATIVEGANRGPQRWIQSGDRARIEVYRPHFDNGAAVDAGRPSRIRGADRPVQLDMRNLDVRAREQDRAEGRDSRRAEQFRMQERRQAPDVNVDRGRGRARNPEAWPERRSGERNSVQPRRRDMQQQMSGNPGTPRPQMQRYQSPSQRRESFDRPGTRQERPAQPRRESVTRSAPQKEQPARSSGRRRDR